MVYVYAADIAKLPDPKECPKIMGTLPKERKEKIMKYKQPQSRKQSLGAGLLLQKVLARHGILAGSVRLGANGKPELDGICFNLSHSHDMAVCAISNKAVGCDVEKIASVPERLAERFFCKNEMAYLMDCDKVKLEEEFFRLWTMKESYVKMTGEGVRAGLDRFEIVFGKEIKIYRDGRIEPCQIKEYEIPEYKLTVCGEEKEFVQNVQWELF